MTTDEAAKIIGITRAQVCWLIRHKKLKARKHKSRWYNYQYEIDLEEARRYAASNRSTGPKPKARRKKK